MSPTPLQPEFSVFAEQYRQSKVVAVSTELSADYETPLSAYHKISEGEYSFLLESAEASGRYSFLGSEPRLIFESLGLDVTITDRRTGQVTKRKVERDPLQELENIMAEFSPVSANGLPVLHGGAVGYLSYDAVRYFEPTVPTPPPDVLGVPDMMFMIADKMLIFDHRHRRIHVVACVVTSGNDDPEAAYEAARGKIDALIGRLEKPVHFKPAITHAQAPKLTPRSNTTKEEYFEMVRRGKEYIRAGDIFQFVPSQRFEVEHQGGAAPIYRALRHVNPSPYMFLLQFRPGFALIGSSPEVHVRAIGGKIEIRPIAGTRWRGKTQAEDEALATELLADPKERAEHIMLVDLARNDVGRIAEYDSVKVTDLMIIERYSHVMHIVSNVVGRLREGRSAYDVMRATFPAGTVSGSPKVRAMQIINELEKNKRCVYAGAVGYFTFDGNLDSCIALRTCVLLDGKCYVQAGGGVVADSTPEGEYQETVNKAMGVIRAIERAQQLI